MGRFITADPTIQHPYDPQDLNRYAYCRNNPLIYTDPTGYKKWYQYFGFDENPLKELWKKIEKPLITTATVVAAAVITGGSGALTVGTLQLATAAAISTVALDTGEGRQFIRRFGNEVFDDVFGMSPKAARFTAYLVTDAVLTAGIAQGLHKMINPMRGALVSPDKLTDEQKLQYTTIENDAIAASTRTNGRVLSQIKPSLRKALVVDGQVKAIIANVPVKIGPVSVPLFEHIAVAIPGGGNFDFSGTQYLFNEGVCHQGRIKALNSIGIDNVTPLDLSSHPSTFLSYGVYGATGHPGATIDNISRAYYYTRLER